MARRLSAKQGVIPFVCASLSEYSIASPSGAKARIDVRIRHVLLGNFGDVRLVGKGILELWIDYGPGYRVYFTQHGNILVILLCGGEKSTQAKDIQKAHELAQALAEE